MPTILDATTKPCTEISGTYNELVEKGYYSKEDMIKALSQVDKEIKCDFCDKFLGYYDLINPEESDNVFACEDCKQKIEVS